MKNKKLDYQFTATPFNLIMLVAVLMYFADTKKQQNYLKILIYCRLKNVLIYVQQNLNSFDPKKNKINAQKTHCAYSVYLSLISYFQWRTQQLENQKFSLLVETTRIFLIF